MQNMAEHICAYLRKEGLKWFWKACRKVKEGLGRFRKVKEGLERFRKV